MKGNILKSKINIEENKNLLSILLKDKTTKRNLIWATDNYKKYGELYKSNCPICVDLITGNHSNIIKPRIEKSKEEQQFRKRNKAEVFTPYWICNMQNNLIDDEWFGYKGSFNIENNKSWITSTKKIKFLNDKTWKDYVELNRLEVSCGEAPYLVSRYDTVSGKYIEVKDRIGFLDRKLRIINENINSEQEWIKWSTEAVKSIYGYDWQGDNVLLARKNVLYTLIEFYEYKFNKLIDIDLLINYAKIISWNIWQMDGISMTIPNSEKHCKIMDWEKHKSIKFIDLLI